MCVEEQAEERGCAAGPAHAAVSVSLRAPESLTLPPDLLHTELSHALFLGLVTTQTELLLGLSVTLIS